MKKSLTPFEAIIWDMDGVIVDSESIWPQAQPSWIMKNFPQFPKENCSAFMGQGPENIFYLVQKYYPDLQKNIFLEEIEKMPLRDVYPHAKIFPGIVESLQKFSATHQQAIASSALQSWIDVVVEKNDLGKFFQQIISSEHVEGRSKPRPDIFLYAARQLQVDPKKCIVIEDSNNGVLAAKSAGMTVGVFLSDSNKNRNIEGGDFYFEDFNELENMIDSYRK